LLGRPGRGEVDVVLVERQHRNAARRQPARAGAADEAVGAEHDDPARFLRRAIEVLQHVTFLLRGAFPLRLAAGHAAAVRTGLARSMRWRRRGEFSASHRSLRRCTFSQNSALLLNTRASIRAVSAVIARRLLHSSLTCLRGTPIALARSPW